MFAEFTMTELLMIIGPVAAAGAAAIAVLWRQSLAAKDAHLAYITEQTKSYRQMAEQSINKLELLAAKKAVDEGRVPVPLLAKVIPEHASPTTIRQKEAAELADMRARLTAAELGNDLPAREDLGGDPIKEDKTTPTILGGK